MPVTTGVVTTKTVPVELEAVGKVEPLSTVDVLARVGGELTAVRFAEGQEVQKGQVLFTIDPRPFQAALDQAQAAVARDKAVAANSASDLKRYGDLVQKEYVTREQYDRIAADTASSGATVKADEAAVEAARLQLEYCTIRAPLTGRTGSLLVHAGNLVKANDAQPLVVIHQIQPIYVSFAVPEGELAGIERYRREGHLTVESVPSEGNGAAQEGALTFVDNQIDRTTGTILLKATFPNATRTLWPGQFTKVRLTLARQANAVVVPAQAVQTGQQGQYVYVVRADQTVENRGRPGGAHGGGRGGDRRRPDARRDGGHRRPAPPGAGSEDPGQERRAGGGIGGTGKGRGMNLSALFIRRPVMTTLVMRGILLFGIMAYRLLPVSDLPNVDFPTIQVHGGAAGRQPGDDGLRGRHAAGAAVLHHRRPRLDDLDQRPGQHPDHAAVRPQPQHRRRRAGRAGGDRRRRPAAAAGHADAAVLSEGESGRPADPLPGAHLRRRCRCTTLDEYAETLMAQRISTVAGVAQVQVFGAQKYAVRVQLDPAGRSPPRGIGIDEVATAVQAANVNLPTGTLYGAHQAFTVQANGQLIDAAAYRPLIVAYRNGAPVRLQRPRHASSTASRTTRPRPGSTTSAASSSPFSASPAPTPSRWPTAIKQAAADVPPAAARRRSTSTSLYDRSESIRDSVERRQVHPAADAVAWWCW